MILQEMKKDVSTGGLGEATNFRIQADAKAFNILSSNIYTDKIKAVIRELSCNAYDAHVDVGNSDPFKVHLPTSLEPWFSVRDYGTGLSHEDCMSLYTTYFASTKTSSNDVVGCLGIGSKSPYAVSDSFSVISRYNGVERHYTAYKDENDFPQFALLTESDTSESNGLEVRVNVGSNYGDWASKCVEVFQYFDSIPNINNAAVVEQINEAKNSYEFIGEGYKVSRGYGDIIARMGNVGYEVGDSIVPNHNNNYGIVLDFPIGSLTFNPGRENLTATESTINAVRSRLEEIHSELIDSIVKSVENADTEFEKYEKITECYNIAMRLGKNSDFKKLHAEYVQKFTCHYTSHNKRPYRTNIVRYNEYHNIPAGKNVIYVLNSRGAVARIRNCVTTKDVYITIDQSELDKIPPIPYITVDDLPKVERSTASPRKRSKARSKVSLFTESNYSETWVDTEIENNKEERVYIPIHRYDPVSTVFKTNYSLRSVCSNFGINPVPIYGLKNAFMKTNAFKNGNWITLEDYIKREFKTFSINKYSGNYTKMYKLLSEYTSEELITEFNELAGQEIIVEEKLLRAVGIDIDKLEINYRMDEIEKELWAKFPMLVFVEHYQTTPHHLQTIGDYINGNSNS